ncbi:MAG: DUF4124 domain-containing protein [Dokdonella sp.]
MPLRKLSFIRWLVALGLVVATTTAPAQTVFKCVDSDARVAFQQQPCPAGVAERRIEIAAAAPTHAVVDARMRKERKTPVARMRQSRAETPAMSFRCTSGSGAVFFRHSRCPQSIPRAPGTAAAGKADGKADPVSATHIPRRDACRQIGAFARTGREHDENVSTYERNAGRDPCRRH